MFSIVFTFRSNMKFHVLSVVSCDGLAHREPAGDVREHVDATELAGDVVDDFLRGGRIGEIADQRQVRARRCR